MQSTPQNITPSTLLFVVPEEEWRNLHDTLEQIMDLIARRNADDAKSEWIESEAARKLLGISPPRRDRITATSALFPSRR